MRNSTQITAVSRAFVCLVSLFVVSSTLSAASQAQVDLSGTYNVATLTPLERPAHLGDKAQITAAEAKQLADYWAGYIAADANQSDPNREAPPEGGIEFALPGLEGAAGGVGGYNAFYIDVGEGNFKLDGKYRTSIITHPANGRRPAFTPRGLAQAKRERANYNKNTGAAWWLEKGVTPYDNPEDRPLAERCLLGFGSTAGPPALPVLYNNLKRIVQTPDRIIIFNEMNHDTRIIRMDAAHLPEHMRSWMGDSVGRWEGDTLVVDTTNFRDDQALSMASRDLHVVEKFSRIDADTLRYEFTVNDPNWSEPWSGEYPWPASPDKIYEYACHEGNYALGGILRGARILEAEALQASGG